jgi:hypothetical protein
MCVLEQYHSTVTEQNLGKTRNYCTTFYISLCCSRGWFSWVCFWPLSATYCCLASTHSAAMLVTSWFRRFYFWPLSSHCCLASIHFAAMLVTSWFRRFYFWPLSSHCCPASTHSAAMLVTFWFTWFYFRPLSSHCWLAPFFLCYVDILVIQHVLFLVSGFNNWLTSSFPVQCW